MKSSRLQNRALEKERKIDELLQWQLWQEQEEKSRKNEEATEAIRRFVHLMHISLDCIGHPLEIGTEISVFWKDDDEWYNGLIDTYDPISNVHGVLYFDGEREELILQDEIFKIVAYPKPLADMINQYSDNVSTYSASQDYAGQQCHYTEDFSLPIDIILAPPPDNTSGDYLHIQSPHYQSSYILLFHDTMCSFCFRFRNIRRVETFR